MMHTREHVEQRSIGRLSKADAVGGNHGHAVGLRQRVSAALAASSSRSR